MDAEASLEDVLSFSSGADYIPPLGFPIMPTLQFLHDSSSKYPQANTCSIILKLPIVHLSYDDFKANMDFGILNGKVFAFS